MKLKLVLLDVFAFLVIWIGVDAAMGQLGASTVKECIAGLTMAAMLYFD
jgi:hypothetical protein